MRRLPAPLLLGWVGTLGPACDGRCVVAPSALVAGAVPTVARLSWSSGMDDGSAEVTWEAAGETSRVQAVSGGVGRWEAVLVGLPPSAEVTWSVRVGEGEGACAGDGEPFVSGAVPPEVPSLSLTGGGEGSTLDGFLVTTLSSVQAWPAMVTPGGRVAWWTRVSDGSLFVTRTRPAGDGRGILHNVFRWVADDEGVQSSTDAAIRRVSWTGEVEATVETPGGHHDFVELPDGALAWIAGEVGDVEGTWTRGDGIVERSPAGEVHTVWSPWDDVARYRAWSSDPASPLPEANALDYDPVDDVYYLGLRTQGSIVRIRRTGQVDWVLGGAGSTFEVSPTPPFTMQHQFDVEAGRILVFDNGAEQDLASRLVEVAFDEGAGIAGETWTWATEPPYYTYAMGDASFLDDDHRLVAWGAQGQVDEVTPEGEAVRTLNLELGAGLGYLLHQPSLAPVP